MGSKEDNVLRLVLENSPMKQWHFGEVVREAKVARAVANKWLKRLVREGLLRRRKEKGRFPYFVVGGGNPVYYSRKKIYALQQLYRSGLISCLLGLEGAETVVIFGSMAKGDWYRDSDVDVFICGKVDRLDKSKYEARLKREIELHVFRNIKEIKAVRTGLIKNVINGYLVKGDMQVLADAL